MGSAICLLGLETFGVVCFYGGADAGDDGGWEGEETDAVAAVEGEGGEGGAEGCVCWGIGGCGGGFLVWRGRGTAFLVRVLGVHREVGMMLKYGEAEALDDVNEAAVCSPKKLRDMFVSIDC